MHLLLLLVFKVFASVGLVGFDSAPSKEQKLKRAVVPFPGTRFRWSKKKDKLWTRPERTDA